MGLGLAALAALPYAALCSARVGEPLFRLGFSGGLLWTWVASGGFLLLIALPELAGWRRGSRPAATDRAPRAPDRIAYLVIIVVLALLSVAVPLVQGNETKFFNLGVTLLAVPAAGGWVRLAGTRAGAAARAVFFCLCVPTAALGLSGFFTERGLDVYGQVRPRAGESEAYQWLAAHSDRRAGVVEMPTDSLGHVDLDVVVHARRGLVWAGPEFARRWGYPAGWLLPRARLARELGAGRFEPRDEALLVALARAGISECYLVRRAGAGAEAGGSGARPPRPPAPWTPVFENAGVTLYRFGESAPLLAARRGS